MTLKDYFRIGDVELKSYTTNGKTYWFYVRKANILGHHIYINAFSKFNMDFIDDDRFVKGLKLTDEIPREFSYENIHGLSIIPQRIIGMNREEFDRLVQGKEYGFLCSICSIYIEQTRGTDSCYTVDFQFKNTDWMSEYPKEWNHIDGDTVCNLEDL